MPVSEFAPSRFEERRKQFWCTWTRRSGGMRSGLWQKGWTCQSWDETRV